jgi:hypothetical protein
LKYIAKSAADHNASAIKSTMNNRLRGFMVITPGAADGSCAA